MLFRSCLSNLKSYIKFDKQAVYQTDAVAKKETPVAQAPVEEAPVQVEEETVQPAEEEKKDEE